MRDRLFVATRKGLFTVERHASRSPSRWRVTAAAFVGDNVTSVLCDPRTGHLIVALDHGHFGVKLHRSEDDGTSWTERPAPSYPERPQGAEDVDPNTQLPVPWTTQLVWTLEAGHGDQDGRLWCGTIPGGVFRSDDDGATWQLVRSLWDRAERREWFGGGYDYPGAHSICVNPTNGTHVTVAVSCGGVWVTSDAGATWDCRADGMWAAYMPPDRARDPHIQDPHRVVQCPTAPDTLWSQHHNGIFRSADGGVSWADVSCSTPSAFGFTVGVHPHDPKTAWFVPGVSDEQRVPVGGRLVVTRTRDGGATYDQLTNGLPGEHAYDIAYRHALDVSGDGAYLAFGTTTGSLWLSENEGDRWETVSHHLPPIHHVRFAPRLEAKGLSR